MAEKLSDKLKGLFKRADISLGKGVDKASSVKIPKISDLFSADRGAPPKGAYPKMSEFKSFKAGQALSGKTIPSGSKALVTAKKAKQFRNIAKLKTVGRTLSRAALPVAAGFEAANIVYKVATRSPEEKARTKKLKTRLSKTSTKDYHADLLKMSNGGEMLKNPKKADLDKDGKLSGYEKKRGKAIEANMMKANKGMSVKSDNKRDIRKTESMIGASKSSKREKKIMKANVGMAAKKVTENQMMKASTGKSVRGFGAARTSGMGLQDEQLPPGKSLDYYKDLM